MDESKLEIEYILWRFLVEADDLVPIYVGIDPGSEGSIGFVTGAGTGLSAVVDIPTFKVKKGKRNQTLFHHPLIINLFRKLQPDSHRAYILVEEPPPGFGGKSSPYAQFRLGCAFAMWPLFLESLGFKVTTVSPKSWKNKMKLTSNKERSRKKAIGMFPTAPLSRKKDHNRAEALMLAVYHRNQLERK